MSYSHASKYAGVITAGILALTFAARPAQAGEVTIDFVAASPIGSGFSYDLAFTLLTTDQINASSVQAAPTNSNPNATESYGAYTIEGVTGTLDKVQTSNNTVYSSAALSDLQAAGTAIGVNSPTDNLLFPLLATSNALILDANGNAQTDTGPIADVNALAFDNQGFAFDLGGQSVQLTADLANTGLYLLTTPTTTLLLKKGGTSVEFQNFANVTEVPAPAPLALLGAGLVGVGLVRRRRRNILGTGIPA